MQRLLYTTLTLLCCAQVFAQAPQGITYQAVARGNAGNVLPDSALTVRMGILLDSPSGDLLWQETQDAAQLAGVARRSLRGGRGLQVERRLRERAIPEHPRARQPSPRRRGAQREHLVLAHEQLLGAGARSATLRAPWFVLEA